MKKSRIIIVTVMVTALLCTTGVASAAGPHGGNANNNAWQGLFKMAGNHLHQKCVAEDCIFYHERHNANANVSGDGNVDTSARPGFHDPENCPNPDCTYPDCPTPKRDGTGYGASKHNGAGQGHGHGGGHGKHR